MSSAPTVSPTVEPTWDEQLTALAAFVEQHQGRFPLTRSDNPAVIALARWWVAQNMSPTQDKMPAARREQLDVLRRRAEALRAEQKSRRGEQVVAEQATRSRARSAAAGAAAAVAAREALNNPYLVPGDREILQLRIDHPQASLAELAAMAGKSKGQFESKYYGALHRVPRSLSPLKKDPKDRIYEPGEAADAIGVTRTILSRWTVAGLVQASKNRQGHRRYTGAEVQRVKALISEGWPQEFKDGGEPRPRRRRR